MQASVSEEKSRMVRLYDEVRASVKEGMSF